MRDDERFGPRTSSRKPCYAKHLEAVTRRVIA